MPMYTWIDEECKTETQVIRPVADIDIKPTVEEQECDCKQPIWRRILCSQVFRWRYNDQ